MLELITIGFMMEPNHRIICVNELIQQTYRGLQELEYSEGSLKTYRYSFSLFEKYAKKQEVEYYSQHLALAFLEEYCEIFSNSDSSKYSYQTRKRAISKLDEMYKYNLVSSKKFLSRKKYIFYGCLQKSIETFFAFKSETLSSARLQSMRLYLERFSLYISMISEIQSVNDLKMSHIMEFIGSCSIYTHNTLYATVICLRRYLIYLENNNFLHQIFSTSLPKIAKRRERSFPHAFSKQETQLLLESITNNNPKERRDYAMVLLAARLGLRSSDIVNLKFDNIDWEKNEISIVQQKTKRPLTLPLFNDVGEAIINYVKNGRPNVKDVHVFIRQSKPYMKINAASLFTIVDGYLKRANIKIPVGQKHGPHALRHSLATLLLEDNVPISTIKEILAHKSVETTKIYLKIAQSQLFQCVLDVPMLNSCNESGETDVL